MVSPIEMTGDEFVSIFVPYGAKIFSKAVGKTTASFRKCRVCSIVTPETSLIAFSVIKCREYITGCKHEEKVGRTRKLPCASKTRI